MRSCFLVIRLPSRPGGAAREALALNARVLRLVQSSNGGVTTHCQPVSQSPSDACFLLTSRCHPSFCTAPTSPPLLCNSHTTIPHRLTNTSRPPHSQLPRLRPPLLLPRRVRRSLGEFERIVCGRRDRRRTPSALRVLLRRGEAC